MDILVNSKNANLLENVEDKDGVWKLVDRGSLDERMLSSHTTSPTTVDWNKNGVPDLLIGAEDGHMYFKSR